MTAKRPPITEIRDGAELRRWYWLKSELVELAKYHGITYAGQKFDILDRIAHYLDTGTVPKSRNTAPGTKSKFDWHSAPLSRETLITDSYKNSQNVRRFFKEHCGDSFKFNIAFMSWMRDNVGKTLGDAITYYEEMRTEEATPGFKSQIAHHNQFNQYTRDFLNANPGASMADVRKIWAKKRALPSETGRHIYEPSDLEL